MNVSIFGSGYVGLVTGACFADVGHRVLCVDIDDAKVAGLNQGVIPIFEPGLESLVKRNLADGRLRFTTDAAWGVAESDLIFIAVGTPPNEDGSADVGQVLAVARVIAQHMEGTKIVVDKSTVPVGTADRVRGVMTDVLETRGRADLQFHVCSNPEFLKEGSALEDFRGSARIVVGTESEDVRQAMRRFYRPMTRHHEKLMFMDIRAAELTKYAANAMLATKISFINEIANIAELLGADIEQVRRGIGSDPRIGYHFIYPGCGYGGSCFPKDIRALVTTAEEVGYKAVLLEAVESVNRRQKGTLFRKLSQAFNGDLSRRKVAIWGLAFKPNTDDMREAPSRALMESLWEAGASVRAYDPEAGDAAVRLYGHRNDFYVAGSRDEAIEGADALVICTEWNAFRTVDFAWLKAQLRTPVIVDGRNLFDPQTVRDAGISYFAVGRGDSLSG